MSLVNPFVSNSKVNSSIANTLEVIDNKYSIDGWTFPSSEDPSQNRNPLYYHNGDHTRMVIDDTLLLSEGLGLTSMETNIAVMAASNHDIEQDLVELGANESASRRLLEEELSKLGFSRVAIMAGGLAITGTTPRFEDGTIVQRAVEQCYPTKRAELIAHAVAGADVGRLFGSFGPLLSHKLFLELQTKNQIPVTIQELIKFQNNQIDFLENYQYPTKEIENLLSTNRAGAIKHIIKLIRNLESGQIAKFEEVIQQDLEFIHKTS